MPFLVDSVTMELAKHGLAAKLVVHPQLRVRRDVTGTLLEVVGPRAGRPARSEDEHRAGPTTVLGRVVDAHRAVAKPAACKAEAIAADLDRVLSDVRVAVEDYPQMRARRCGWPTTS